MATRYSRMSAGPQIILLFLLVLALVAGGLIWFDSLGLLDITDTIAPIIELVGGEDRAPLEEADDIMLMDRLRLESLQQTVEMREAELGQSSRELEERALALEERARELEEREQEIAEREISLNERLQRYENRRVVLEQNSRDLTSMRPDDAVEILLGYDDQLLIETLRVTEELAQQAGELSLVSVWLSRFPADRAAEIQRKMTLRPQE